MDLVGAVFERGTTKPPTEFRPINISSRDTGFPPVSRPHKNVKSAFKSRIDAGKSPKTQPESSSSGSGEIGAGVGVGDDWRDQMSRENQFKVDSMTDEERERERQDVMAQLGLTDDTDVTAILKKVRSRQVAHDADAVPVERKSPPRACVPIHPMSASPTRSSSPTRRLRFAELTADDVHVYESAPPSPKKRVLSLPAPPTDAESRQDIVSLGDYGAEEGSPEFIRRKYFPSAPAFNADLEWMKWDKKEESTASPGALRFDLSGKPIPPSLSNTLPTHLGLHHHAEGTHAGYTLDDVLLLVRSTVGAQRAAMLGILKGVISLLKDLQQMYPDPDTEILVAQLRTTTATIVKKIMFAALEVLSENGSVGARAVELTWECLTGWDDTEVPPEDEARVNVNSLISAIPMSIFLPQLSKNLATPPDFNLVDRPSILTPSQRILSSLLMLFATFSDALCEEIVKTPKLISIITRTFIFPSPPDFTTTGLETDTLNLFITLATASRTAAKELSDLNVGNTVVRLLVMSLGELENIPGQEDRLQVRRNHISIMKSSLRLLTTWGRYGMKSNTPRDLSDITRRVGNVVTASMSGGDISLCSVWATLLETWIVCATDPHRTTPEHDLLWSQVSAWGWSDDLLGLLSVVRSQQTSESIQVMGALWRALASWIEGCRVNCIRAGEKEREDVLAIIKVGFETGLERDILKSTIDGFVETLTVMTPESLPTELPKLASHSTILTSAVRLWLACTPPIPSSPPSPPYALPFPHLSEAAVKLVSHPFWNHTSIPSFSASLRPLTSFLAYYLRLSKVLPGNSQDLWLAQSFSIVLRMHPGDESYTSEILNGIADTMTLEWAKARGLPAIIWEKGGVQLLRPFYDIVLAPLVNKKGGEEGEDDAEVREIVSPLYPTPRSIKECTTQRVNASTSGLSLAHDWVFFPLNNLLRSGSTTSHPVKSPWDATETDIVRATLLLARVQQEVVIGAKGIALLTREEVIFGCMKVFMLEHGVDDKLTLSGEEVFRDKVVSSFMTSLLNRHNLPSSDLEVVSHPFLGVSTPFYQFYTDFVALYDAISFADPVFARLLLPPTSMRYAGDYRKHLWNDFGHLVKTIKVEVDDVVTGDVKEYMWPLEVDPQIVAAYVRALVRYGSAMGEFVRWVAIHHVSGYLWGDVDDGSNKREMRSVENLMRVVVEQLDVTDLRDVVGYRQLDGEKLSPPPHCYLGILPQHLKAGRMELVSKLKLNDRLAALWAEF